MHKAKLASVPNAAPHAAPIEKTTLPNGLTVITETVKTVRSVSVGLWTETGSRDESPTQNGISHFIEHLVFKGTKKRDYIEISKSLERVGGYLNAYTTKEQTCFYARVLDEHIAVAVDVLADLVFNPTFPADELEKEKDVVIEEIKSTEDTPDDLIGDEFDEFFYGGHPLGMPIAGTEKTVRSFTRQEIDNYLRQTYTTDKMLLVAAGNISHAEMLRLAEKYIPKRRHTAAKPRQHYRHETYVPFVKEKAKPISQAHVMLGFPFARNDDRYYAALLLNTVLGGGMSSRLNLELREKQGLAYTIYSSLHSYDETNMLNIYIGTDKEKTDKSVRLIKDELKKLIDKPVSPKELDLSKAQLKGGIIMAQESMSSRMSHLARDIYYFGRNVSSDEVIDRINATTPKEIRALAEMLFDDSRCSMLSYLPKKKK
ncbi:MAG: hypothetical protein HY22_00410 [[Candidatus Thermochlorobacteriaceae] bacterium GBChlB]|nr:MAG: hypothetical protein HY22_00410 [[Candidatus Thermochlorobacteriaceae] bacterium GBChlB]